MGDQVHCRYTARMTTALARVIPLVLERRAEAFNHPDWLFEVKYDGFRALLEMDGSGARLVSRNRRFGHRLKNSLVFPGSIRDLFSIQFRGHSD